MSTTSVMAQSGRRRTLPSISTRPHRIPGPYLLLFLVLLTVWSYTPPRWQDWNQNSRFDLTRAIVERGTVRIDAYVDNTGDYARINGHTYTDKAPGLSLLAVPVYAVTTWLRPLGLSQLSDRLAGTTAFRSTLTPGGADTSRERVEQATALYLATVVTVAIPAAIMMVLLAYMVARLSGCRTAGILAALIMALATPVFTYAQAFYGHVPAAACLVGALALLMLRDVPGVSTGRLALTGALLGTAAIIEYPAALPGALVALLAVALARRRAVLWGTLGAVPPLATLAVYDLVAFGTVLPIGYEHSVLWQVQHDTGFLSLTYPRWDALYGITFGGFRGLFTLSPVLLLALPGAVLAWRDHRERGPIWVATLGFAAMVVFVSSSVMWWGGFAVGPRYLVPALPLLTLPLGAAVARINRLQTPFRIVGMAAVAAASAISAAGVWLQTFARQTYPPDTIRSPVWNYALPAWRDGDIARNLGMAFQLPGSLSLLPLVLVSTLGVALMGYALIVSARVPE